jgi:hypothetical protein
MRARHVMSRARPAGARADRGSHLARAPGPFLPRDEAGLEELFVRRNGGTMSPIRGETCAPCEDCPWCFFREKLRRDRLLLMRTVALAARAVRAVFRAVPELDPKDRNFQRLRIALAKLETALDDARKDVS